MEVNVCVCVCCVAMYASDPWAQMDWDVEGIAGFLKWEAGQPYADYSLQPCISLSLSISLVLSICLVHISGIFFCSLSDVASENIKHLICLITEKSVYSFPVALIGFPLEDGPIIQ